MAAETNGLTRSQKTTTPDDPTEKPTFAPQTRSLRSSKVASTGIVLRGNCTVVITKLRSDNVKAISVKRPLARKRTRVDNGELVNRLEDESERKVFHVVFLLSSICKRVATIGQSGFVNSELLIV